MTSKYDGRIILTAPLSHNGDTPASTETLIRRERLVTRGGEIEEIPVYSGNAFRGILRRLAAAHLCEMVGVQPGTEAYYTLFSGGMLDKGGDGGPLDIGERRRVRALVPMVALFGGCVGNAIMGGMLEIGILRPWCRELFEDAPHSHHDLTDSPFYTRRDDNPNEGSADRTSQMKYSVECLITGTELRHSIVVRSDDPIVLGCFGLAMRRLIDRGKLGGKGNVGHGSCAMQYAPELPDVAPYLLHLDAEQERIVEWIKSLDAPKRAKKEKASA